MISKDDLLAIAKLKGLPLSLAESDYLQDIALMNISGEFGNRLIFKGGTCLYKAYKLNRFSEDLDFTATKNFKAGKFFERLPHLFGLLNINCRVRLNRFANATNVYLDIHGPLYDGSKETVKTLILNISFRERVLLPVVRHPYLPGYDEIRPFDLFVMAEEEILAEKVRSIYTRDKARDMYDLWYLLVRKSLPFDRALANKKLSHARIKFSMAAFIAKIDAKKGSWRKDLSALISGELPDFDKVRKEIEQRISE